MAKKEDRYVYRAGDGGETKHVANTPEKNIQIEIEPASPNNKKTNKKSFNNSLEKTEKNTKKSTSKNIEKNNTKNPFSDMPSLKKTLLAAASMLMLACLVIMLVLIPSCNTQVPAPAQSSSSASLASDSAMGDGLVKESGYDPNAIVLPTDQLAGTILAETEDAGMEYAKETIFLGDSNTVRMISYRDVTGVTYENGIGVEGMGIHQVNTLKCVQFEGYAAMITMPEAVAILQPKRVVITFGTNNVGGMNVDAFITHYKNALDAINEAYPYTDIIIGAVPPVDVYHSNSSITMSGIDAYNLALAQLADEEGYKFLNWGDALRDESTGFCISEYTVKDGIHVSRDGMEALFEYFRTHAYIAEDRRPKPLNTIPARIYKEISLITNDGDTKSTSQAPSSSEAPRTVTISWGVRVEGFYGEGGTLTIDGVSTPSYSLVLDPGQSTPSATAVPASGYRFAGWEATGMSVSGGSATLNGFAIDESLAGGSVSFVAVFERGGESETTTSLPEGTESLPEGENPEDPGTVESLPQPDVPPADNAGGEEEGG